MPTPETLKHFRILGVFIFFGGLLLMGAWGGFDLRGIGMCVTGFIVWLGAKLVGRRHHE